MMTRLSFHIVKIIGTLLLVFAFTSHLWGFPHEAIWQVNVGEALAGMILIAIDLPQFVRELVQVLLNRFSNGKR